LVTTGVTIQRRSAAAVLAVGLALMALGLLINWKVGRGRGEDFAYLYIVGKAVAGGKNAYDAAVQQPGFAAYLGYQPPAGIYYPPSTGIVILPFTLLPYAVGQAAWFCLLTGVLMAGIWELLATFAPESRPATRVLLLGLVLCSSSLRWGFQLLQSAPLALGLLGLFLAALARNRQGEAFLYVSALAWLKMTLAVPLILLALAQRRFALVASVLVLWAAVNCLGFARMGGVEAVQAYQQNVARMDRPGSQDYADPHLPNALTRLEWSYLLNAVSPEVSRSRKLSLLLFVASALWLGWEAWRSRAFVREAATTGAFLAPILCLCLLGMYHHHYDACLLLAPLLVYACRPQDLRRLPGVLWFALPVTLYACLYPIYQVQLFASRHFGDVSYLYLRLLGCVVVTVAFLASLVALHRHIGLQSAGRRPEAAPSEG